MEIIDNMTLQINKFRSSYLWQTKRKEIVLRDAGVCRVCLYNGIVHAHDLSVHHITPLASDFSRRLDDFNLLTLCPLHHEQAEKGELDRDFLFRLACEKPMIREK